MNLNPLRAAVAPYADLLKLGVLLSALALVAWFFFDMGRDRWQGKYDTEAAAHLATKAEHKAIIGQLAEMTRAAADKAKAASERAKTDRKTNDTTFRMLSDEAQQARSDLARALRRGTVGLRPEFTCPASRSAEGGVATAAGGQDGDAALRRAREGAILDAIGDADHADRWIGWLQSELISTRTACGASP